MGGGGLRDWVEHIPGDDVLDGLSTCLFQAWRMQGGLELFKLRGK